MSGVTLTLLQPNSTTGKLAENFQGIQAILDALPKVAGSQLVVIPAKSLEGVSGKKVLFWPVARENYSTMIEKVVEFAQGDTALVMSVIDLSGQEKTLFAHHGEYALLPRETSLEWGGIEFDIHKKAAGRALLDIHRVSLAGNRVEKLGTHVPTFFVSIAGGDATYIAAGDSGYYFKEEVVPLPHWQSGTIRFKVQINEQKQFTVKRVYQTTAQFPVCSLNDTYEALRAGLRDYVTKNRIKGVVLGLSGGVDSALAATLAVDALGADKVKGILLPSRFTSEQSLRCAEELVDHLEIETETISIEPIFNASLKTLAPIFGKAAWDVTEENLQARARALILMGVANKEGRLLLCTSNKAEASMGYGTLYGDITGGYAPLIDLWKREIYELCRSRNARAGCDWIPSEILERAPSAELREGQLDSDSLPPYDEIEIVVDTLLKGGAAEELKERYGEAKVNDIVHRFFANAYKRAQGIPGPTVSKTPLATTREWGMGGDWLI